MDVLELFCQVAWDPVPQVDRHHWKWGGGNGSWAGGLGLRQLSIVIYPWYHDQNHNHTYHTYIIIFIVPASLGIHVDIPHTGNYPPSLNMLSMMMVLKIILIMSIMLILLELILINWIQPWPVNAICSEGELWRLKYQFSKNLIPVHHFLKSFSVFFAGPGVRVLDGRSHFWARAECPLCCENLPPYPCSLSWWWWWLWSCQILDNDVMMPCDGNWQWCHVTELVKRMVTMTNLGCW